jgi:uncharacterized protein (DUF1015 family)
MAKVVPFKAVRPTRGLANLVASRSYEAYSAAELGAQLDFNPYTFLHIINPGYKFQQEIDKATRFKLVKNKFHEFKENKTLIKDETPCYYVYEKTNDKHSFCGIIAATSTDDYKNGLIRIHEDTIASRERLFKDYLKTVGFNSEPVLLTYPDNKSISDIMKKHKSERPEYEFATHDKHTHRVWLVKDMNDIRSIQQEFDSMSSIYIADGHHRTASSYLLAEELKSKNKNHTGDEPYNYFMSYLIPESDLQVYEFNRLVKDLNGLTKEQFLIKLDTIFRIQNRGLQLYKPSKKHHFNMYLDGEFYSLYLRKTIFDIKDSLTDLDAQLLYQTVLKPILGIKDLRNDRRIAYSHGKNDIIHVKQRVDDGEFKVAFGMIPATIEQIKQIADDGLKMPPKSTYIEPKLRSGLTIYEF